MACTEPQCLYKAPLYFFLPILLISLDQTPSKTRIFYSFPVEASRCCSTPSFITDVTVVIPPSQHLTKVTSLQTILRTDLLCCVKLLTLRVLQMDRQTTWTSSTTASKPRRKGSRGPHLPTTRSSNWRSASSTRSTCHPQTGTKSRVSWASATHRSSRGFRTGALSWSVTWRSSKRT